MIADRILIALGSVAALVAAIFIWWIGYLLAAIKFLGFVAVAGWFRSDFGGWVPFFQLWDYWGEPMVMRLAGIGCVAVPVAAGGVAAVWLAKPWQAGRPPGSADWGNARTLKKAGLLDGEKGVSVLLGSFGGRDVRYSGDSHICVNGPTRSGKGYSFVMPNCMEWSGALVCIDLKLENFEKTGPARHAMGQQVFVFSPGSARSHCWNPLGYIGPWPRRATEVSNMANSLVPLPPNGDIMWAATARSLFEGVLAYVLESPECEGRRTLRTVLECFVGTSDLAAWMLDVLKAEPRLHVFIRDKFANHMGKDMKQRASFENHVTLALNPWNNPAVIGATSRNDFDIREMRRKPFSVFIGTPAGDLASREGVIRLFIQQIHDVLIAKMPEPDEKFKLLIMLDEMAQFKRMPEVVDRAPLVAGYGFKIAFVFQDLAQLDQIYGRPAREAILANTDVKLFIASGGEITSDWISRNLGKRAVPRESESFSKGGWGKPASSSRQKGWEMKPLLAPEEVALTGPADSILFVRGTPGAKVRKANFYTQARFAAPAGDNAHVSMQIEIPEVPAIAAYGVENADGNQVVVAMAGAGATAGAGTPSSAAVIPTADARPRMTSAAECWDKRFGKTNGDFAAPDRSRAANVANRTDSAIAAALASGAEAAVEGPSSAVAPPGELEKAGDAVSAAVMDESEKSAAQVVAYLAGSGEFVAPAVAGVMARELPARARAVARHRSAQMARA